MSSTSQTPFWLRANALGVVPNTGTNFTFRGGFYQEYATKNNQVKKYNWGYGINGVANINQEGVDLILPEAYIKAKAGIFEIWAGRRQEVMGLSDSSGIGTGPITLSGNAIPMPKVQFLTPNWVNLGFKGLFAAKVSYAHGWFDNGGIVENYYLYHFPYVSKHLRQSNFLVVRNWFLIWVLIMVMSMKMCLECHLELEKVGKSKIF